MKRVLVVTGVVLAALALVLVGYYAFSQKEAEDIAPPEPLPGFGLPPTGPSGPSTLPTGNTITIGTPYGTVAIRNIYRNPVFSQPGVYVLASRSGDYDLVYFPQEGQFLITLNRGPVNEVVANIEEDIAANLGVSRRDACKLDPVIRITRGIDEARAGEELRLSFCAEGVYNKSQ
jgi:hypothetical protein